MTTREGGSLGGSLRLDTYGTQKHPRVRGWLARHPRSHLHCPPTGTSWLNQVERWFARLPQKPIRRGSCTSVRDLVLKIKRALDLTNHHPLARRLDDIRRRALWNALRDVESYFRVSTLALL